MNKIVLEKGHCPDCYYFSYWQEYGMWFEDCNHPSGYSLINNELELAKFLCPLWKEKIVYNCATHGDYLDDCSGCVNLWYMTNYLIEKGFKMTKVIEDILKERDRQISLAHGGDTEKFDKGNTKNDWIAYVNAYIGRAAEKVFRNEKEGQTFRENMVKAAALCVAAIEAHDKDYC